MTRPGADQDLAFLFRHQLAEADIVCASKSDEGIELMPLARIVADVVAHPLSARTGEGVDVWLDHVLGGRIQTGALPLLELDYTRYAAAEAALAWLNWHAQVEFEAPTPPVVVAGALGDSLELEMSRAGLAIAHVKVLDQTESGYVRVSLSGDGRGPAVDGVLDASPAMRHQILINARVVGDPDVLSHVVGQCVRALSGEVQSVLREAFRPGVRS